MVPARLRGLPERAGPGGLRIFVARSFRARLLGLALMEPPPRNCALLLPRCASIHTFGMRFSVDVAFLDASERVLRVVCSVPPGRFLRHGDASAVLEWPAL